MDEQTVGHEQAVGAERSAGGDHAVGQTQGSGLDSGGGLGQAGTRPTDAPDVPSPSGSHAVDADRDIREGGDNSVDSTDSAGPSGAAGIDPERDRRNDPRVDDGTGHDAQVETPAERNLSGDSDHQDRGDSDHPDRGDSDQRDEPRQSPEEFAAEHDPEKHDVSAGEEFRQRGDWTADETGGPQVWDSEGSLVEGAGPGSAGAQGSSSGDDEHYEGHHRDREGHDSDHHESRGDGSERSQPDRGSQQDNDDQGSGGRRTSSVEEIRDGGFGVGSAAPLHDDAMPFGHPVKAWHDTQTFVDTDHPRYDDAEPHVWFADASAAQQAGFRRADD